jgi:hypothetical protein
MTLTLETKDYGSEITWNIDGQIQSAQSYGGDQVYTQSVCLSDGSHTLNMIDSFGDGWHGGFISIGSVLSEAGSDFTDGSSKSVTFTVGGAIGPGITTSASNPTSTQGSYNYDRSYTDDSPVRLLQQPRSAKRRAATLLPEKIVS